MSVTAINKSGMEEAPAQFNFVLFRLNIKNDFYINVEYVGKVCD